MDDNQQDNPTDVASEQPPSVMASLMDSLRREDSQSGGFLGFFCPAECTRHWLNRVLVITSLMVVIAMVLAMVSGVHSLLTCQFNYFTNGGIGFGALFFLVILLNIGFVLGSQGLSKGWASIVLVCLNFLWLILGGFCCIMSGGWGIYKEVKGWGDGYPPYLGGSILITRFKSSYFVDVCNKPIRVFENATCVDYTANRHVAIFMNLLLVFAGFLGMVTSLCMINVGFRFVSKNRAEKRASSAGKKSKKGKSSRAQSASRSRKGMSSRLSERRPSPITAKPPSPIGSKPKLDEEKEEAPEVESVKLDETMKSPKSGRSRTDSLEAAAPVRKTGGGQADFLDQADRYCDEAIKIAQDLRKEPLLPPPPSIFLESSSIDPSSSRVENWKFSWKEFTALDIDNSGSSSCWEDDVTFPSLSPTTTDFTQALKELDKVLDDEDVPIFCGPESEEMAKKCDTKVCQKSPEWESPASMQTAAQSPGLSHGSVCHCSD